MAAITAIRIFFILFHKGPLSFRFIDHRTEENITANEKYKKRDCDEDGVEENTVYYNEAYAVDNIILLKTRANKHKQR